MTLPTCRSCDRPCIPMADYENVPTCARCDNAVAMAISRASITVPVVIYVRKPRRGLAPCGTHAAFNRHKDRSEPIDPACRAGERAYQAEQKRDARTRRRQGAA